MKRETLIIVLSVLIVLSFFIGLPMSVVRWLVPVLAIVVAFLAYGLRRRVSAREPRS